MKIFAFIFARGGSKGIPNKNLIKINNISLLEHSIKIAKKINKINKIIVSSDSNKILNLSEKLGAIPLQRPKKLSNDRAPEWEAWKHAVKNLSKKNHFDIFISLPTTAPLRKCVDINNSLNKFLKFKPDILYTINDSQRNPYFNMVIKNKNNIKRVINRRKFFRRQDAPKTYDLNTVAIVTTPDYILTSPHQFYGKVYGSKIPISRSLDIDTHLDYKIAKLLMEENVR